MRSFTLTSSLRNMKLNAMKVALLSLVLTATACAQAPRARSLEDRVQQIEDRAALKTLVDTFSNLADVKDVGSQVMLFTEDAVVESISDGKPGQAYKGRKQIGDAFSGYLALFDTVYHINGQQTVEVNGDSASGTAYCLVVLIGMEGGKRYRNVAGVRYKDTYVRVDGHWLIARRVSEFTWRSKDEIAAVTPLIQPAQPR